MVAVVHRRGGTRGRRREPRDAARVPHRDGLGGRHEGRVGRARRRRRSWPRWRPLSRPRSGRCAGERLQVQDRARGAGHGRDRGHAAGARRRHGARDRVRRRHDRALLRHGRAARARGPPRREPGRDLRRRRPLLPGRGTRGAIRRSSRRRATGPATTRRTSRSRGCCHRTATASSSRTRRPPTTTSAASDTWSRRGHDRAGRRRAPQQRAPASLRLRVFGGGSPAATLRRYTRHVGRQPAPAARWVWGAWFQPGGPLDEQIGQLEKLQQGRRAGVGDADLPPLPPLRRPGRRPGRGARARGRLPRPRHGGDDVLQPDDLRRLPAPLRRGGRGGRAGDRPRAATRTRTSTRARRRAASTSGSSTSRRQPGARSTSSYWPRRSRTATTAGWRTSASTRRSTRTTRTGWTARGCTTSTRRSTTAPRTTSCAAQERPIVRFQRSGFTGAARCAQVVWSGDPTVGWDFDGLESQIKAGALDGAVGRQHVGLGHRRVLRDRHARAERRAA